MGDGSNIEWTDATWNPVTGCDRISPGCDHCYIERTPPFRMEGRRFDENGRMGVRLHPERLDQPLRWKRPRRIFVNSLSDLFHQDVPSDFVCDVFEVMGRAHWHTFQVLTKRPQRMRSLVGLNVPDAARALPNVWFGASVESEHYAFRARHLTLTPAAVRFLSCEPLLGPVTLDPVVLADIDWLIVGGESGPGARPMHPDWARSLRDQAAAAGVAFHFKQWGEWAPLAERDATEAAPSGSAARQRVVLESAGRAWLMRRVGKKAAGRELDGRTWDEWPTPRVDGASGGAHHVLDPQALP